MPEGDGETPPMKLRLVDTSKGDELHPMCRSRIVAEGFKIGNRPELLAAPTPLKFIK